MNGKSFQKLCPLMEGQLPQGGAADLTGIGQRLTHIETAIGNLCDHLAGDSTVNVGQVLTGRHPTSTNEAL
jgi:hypothetical protein